MTDSNATELFIDDEPPSGTFQVSHDNGRAFFAPVEIQSEQDSREKLEEDVRQLAFDYALSLDSSDKYALRAKVMKLLDRQAMITAQE